MGRQRRQFLGLAGAALTGAFAGCSSGAGGSIEQTDSETPTVTATETATPTDSEYTASIVPVGEVSFADVPEEWFCYNGAWADMAFALGQRDGFQTAGNMIPGFFFEPFGLDVPPRDELTPLWSNGGWDKETFYELDPDLIMIDPRFLEEGWDDSWGPKDTEEIRENVAPFFGNNCRRRRGFHDYKLYSLYGAFERLSRAFREQERYAAMKQLHDELLDDVQGRLPPEGERAEIGLINGGSDPAKGTFYPLSTNSEGYEMKPYRDLDVGSAFPDDISGEIDYETLLEVDPDILVVHWGIGTTGGSGSFSAETFHETYVKPMAEHEVGSELTAVQEGRVYPGQYGEQGPILNLLQTEMVARQLYPDEFGQFDPESFPDVPEDQRLFDRQRVRDIVAGEF